MTLTVRFQPSTIIWPPFACSYNYKLALKLKQLSMQEVMIALGMQRTPIIAQVTKTQMILLHPNVVLAVVVMVKAHVRHEAR